MRQRTPYPSSGDSQGRGPRAMTTHKHEHNANRCLYEDAKGIERCAYESRTYREFQLEHITPPIPTNAYDWQAVHRDYDGPGDHRVFYGPTIASVCDQIDIWWAERGQED